MRSKTFEEPVIAHNARNFRIEIVRQPLPKNPFHDEYNHPEARLFIFECGCRHLGSPFTSLNEEELYQEFDIQSGDYFQPVYKTKYADGTRIFSLDLNNEHDEKDGVGYILVKEKIWKEWAESAITILNGILDEYNHYLNNNVWKIILYRNMEIIAEEEDNYCTLDHFFENDNISRIANFIFDNSSSKLFENKITINSHHSFSDHVQMCQKEKERISQLENFATFSKEFKESASYFVTQVLEEVEDAIVLHDLTNEDIAKMCKEIDFDIGDGWFGFGEQIITFCQNLKEEKHEKNI